MAKQLFNLHPDEVIILKASDVRHGFWGAYTDDLILTNQQLINVRLGVFGNCKGVDYYPLEDIKQIIIGKAKNGEKQLEVYLPTGMEDFAFQNNNERVVRIWHMAIQDRFSDETARRDFNFYQRFYDDNYDLNNSSSSYGQISSTDSSRSEVSNIDKGKFVADVAKSMVNSGNFSVGGVVKGIKKASQKQVTRNIGNSLKDEFGLSEVADEFADVGTEIGNSFREAFGLSRKLTRAELKEKQLNEEFNRKLAEANDPKVIEKEPETISELATSNSNQMTFQERIEAMKQLKELLDMGILTQEEFDQKKKDIMNL